MRMKVVCEREIMVDKKAGRSTDLGSTSRWSELEVW